VIEAVFGTTNTISGVTIAGSSLVKVDDGATLTISGTINNSGAIEIDPAVLSGDHPRADRTAAVDASAARLGCRRRRPASGAGASTMTLLAGSDIVRP